MESNELKHDENMIKKSKLKLKHHLYKNSHNSQICHYKQNECLTKMTHFALNLFSKVLELLQINFLIRDLTS